MGSWYVTEQGNYPEKKNNFINKLYVYWRCTTPDDVVRQRLTTSDAAIQKVLKVIGHLAVQGGLCISKQCAWGHYLVGKSDDEVQQRARQLVSGFYLGNVFPFSLPSVKCELKNSI